MPGTSQPDTTDSPADSPGDRHPDAELDPALEAERRHLAESRAALALMRERVGGLNAVGAAAVSEGPNVSTEHLKQALYRRVQSLQDDPTVPLFFGRLDYQRSDLPARLYIGRRHITGEAGGEPMVIDWRAPISLPFYQATRDQPMDVALRRRFGFSAGSLTAYEDEKLLAGDTLNNSDILESEIERPRTGPMRDIVATIQPEQDVIVRTELSRSVCVQGAPGTGKTAVGLHRAAYLLYAFRDQLSRQGVLVVGPNDSFLSYIADVLPALGEIDATQTTVEALVSRATGLKAGRLEDAASAVIKGDARMAEVIRRAVWSHLRPATGTLVVPRGSHQWRVAAYLADEMVATIKARGVRYAAGRDMLPQRLAHQVLLRMEADGDSPDDRVQNAVARSKPVKAYAEQLWPTLDAAKLVLRLLSEPEFLAAHAEGLLTEAEQQRVSLAKPGRSVKSHKWSVAEIVLVDEAADQLNRTPSLGHVIIDEAQDLSAMQLRAVGRRASTGSVTVLGDLAQATTPWATTSWSDSLGHLGKPEAVVEELVAGFRVPAAVIEFAARLLPDIAPELTPPHSVRRTRGDLVMITSAAPADDLARAVAVALESEGSIGLITPDARLAAVETALGDHRISYAVLGRSITETEDGEPVDEALTRRVDVVPASIAKGLEFDHVVLFEPAAIVAGEPDRVTGLRRLYVCLTRAVTSLQIVHTEPLPSELDPQDQVAA
ncbi:DNA helicase [Microlunatus endophyticus]|uniref:DNA helicase n=1 Tax=Microlunatus endophyticus TaxID=1716077 RepID=A0A917S5K2_9ACTN|nr:AAA family ATPase [Microlunatus endophyticus]GGL57496.1 DNA helicase [Microlunatus endophyticus]